MIGLLRGLIVEKQPPQLLLDVNGIGYEIDAPMSTFYHLPEIGQQVTLHTHFIVREDAQHLYGFYAKEERALFRTLLKVNGIGPRLALTVLSTIDSSEFIRCVINNDVESLVRIPGIGKKTAERLLIDMRDKVTHWESNGAIEVVKAGVNKNQALQDAIAALVALGYKPQAASRAVAKVDEGDLSSEELIRRALREMVA